MPSNPFVDKVEDRLRTMSLAKQPFSEKVTGIQQLLYVHSPWIVSGEAFGEPVRLPTLHDVIRAFVERYMQDYPEAVLIPKEGADPELVKAKQAYLDTIKRSVYEKTMRRMRLEDMISYGIAFSGVEYVKNVKEYGEAGKKTKKTLFDNICSTYIDPRDFFVDDAALKLHDETGQKGARDVIHKRIIPESTFDLLVKEQGWKIPDGLSTVPWWQASGYDEKSLTDQETREKYNTKVYKVFEYQNCETDEYGIVANGKEMYKNSLYACKGTTRLAVVDDQYEPRNDSIWGTSLAELLAPHIYLRDTLINLEIMNLKLTLQPVLAVSGDFGFNAAKHLVQPGGVWQAGGSLQGKVADSIHPIISGNPNTNFYQFHQVLQSEMSITSRIDTRSLEYYKNKTKYETQVQQESSNLHVAVIQSINEIESEAIRTKIMLDVMETFVTYQNEDGVDRTGEIIDYTVDQEDGKAPKFTAKAGAKNHFKLTPEIINAKCEVDVIDKRGMEITKQERVGRLTQVLPMIMNAAAIDPTVNQEISISALVKDYLRDIGVDNEGVFKGSADYEDTINMYRQEIIYGNKVDVPEETRDESLDRFNMLVTMRQNGFYSGEKKTVILWKDWSQKVKDAWNYHFEKTKESIQRVRVGEKKEQAPVPGAPQAQDPLLTGNGAQPNYVNNTPKVPGADPSLLSVQAPQ